MKRPNPRLLAFAARPLPILAALLLPAAVCAQNGGAAETPDAGALNLWEMLQQGGWAMFPLGACSLAMLFLLVFAWRETRRQKFFTPAVIEPAREALERRDADAARHALETRRDSLLARALLPPLKKHRPDEIYARQRDKVEALFTETLEAEENAVGQWITYLNVIAAVAPMIGLLGTVSGMISAFQTLGRGGMGRPELLAADIGEALITTATGLTIGIPAMIGYFVMRNRLNTSMIATTQEGSDLLELLDDADAGPAEEK